MSNLLIRGMSGLVYSLAILTACFSGPMPQVALACILAILAVLEWTRFGSQRIHWLSKLLIMFAIFISIYTFSGLFEVDFLITEICRGLLAFAIGGILITQALRDDATVKGLFQSCFALIYIGVPMILLPMMAHYQGENHPWMLASVFILIWCNDTFAYFFGSAIGRHKLFPRISPNKTWEGFVGGIVGTLAAAIIFHHYLPYMPLLGWLGLALVVLVFGTLGDLFESAIKRSYNIKDSGSFMPGHGGILDRIDSLLFALPMAYFYLRIFENLH
ncbi:MAG: phosphatidate cytidylyltransferase [Owenweeksia sp.]|nr:phosphatidate cytidylyltransferase [Owenweeksia sp.]